MELNGKKINFLGDSITEGHGTSSIEKGFVSIISAENGCTCRNYGIGGTRIARQWVPTDEKYDKDFCGRFDKMDDDADIVAVFGGTNDFGHGDAEFGKMSDRNVSSFYGALHTLYRGLIEKYPCAEIVVITPLHRESEEHPRFDGHVLFDFVKAIREVAAYYSLPVLDLYKEGKFQPAVPVLKEKFMPDGLHPNDEGNKILVRKITAFLRGL